MTMSDLGAIPVGDGPEFLRERRGDVHHESLWSPFRYVGRRLRETTQEMVASAALSASDLVVDYGCADVPYRDLFAGVRYTPTDLPGNPEADLDLRPDGTVPLPDGCCR